MPQTRGSRVIRFIDEFCLTPEGEHVGKPLKLEPFQRDFILAIYDNPHGTSRAILSMARKCGKTSLTAALVLAHVIGPERRQNSQIVSGALSRDQAALVYSLCEKMLHMQPAFHGLYKTVHSSKRIVGLKANAEYKALAADGGTSQGLSPVLAILDEAGQVRGPTSPFIEAILTSQGAHDNPLTIIISTQAPSDADFLSLQIDDALRSGDPHTVCHLYAADKDCDLMDRTQWHKANPALGVFRSEKDLEKQLERATRIPAIEASVRNLLLNQRISLHSLWLAPTVWKSCGAEPDLDVLRGSSHVSLGLDLSMRNDLTAAVFSALDSDGRLHVFPVVFSPETGLKERELRDKAPYTTWVRQGDLIAVPGATLDYDWLCTYLQQLVSSWGVRIATVCFDRWRIKELESSAARCGFAQEAEWIEVGQGYVGMSPRIEHFETYLLQGKLLHGEHPLLNMAAANAVVIRDPANNRKIDKSKATQRIDPLVAAVLSAGAFMVQPSELDVSCWIV